MIGWIILCVLAAIGLLLIFNTKHHVRRIKAIIGILIVILFVVSIVGWYKTGEPDFSTPMNSINSVYLYFAWAGQAGLGLIDVSKGAVVTVGNVIRGNQTLKNFDGRR